MDKLKKLLTSYDKNIISIHVRYEYLCMEFRTGTFGAVDYGELSYEELLGTMRDRMIEIVNLNDLRTKELLQMKEDKDDLIVTDKEMMGLLEYGTLDDLRD